MLLKGLYLSQRDMFQSLDLSVQSIIAPNSLFLNDFTVRFQSLV